MRGSRPRMTADESATFINRARSSAGAKATNCARVRRGCSRRCCRASPSICRAPLRSNLRQLFAVPVTEVALEIGFGGGEAMIAQAQAHPQTGFIGVEPFVNGMAKALAAIEANGLRNIRLHFDDAVDLIAWLPDKSLARIDLIHPDPWPKRRHWKRRFVQDDMVAQLARILRPGGEFRFVTDIADYAAWTLQRLMRSSDFEWTAQAPTIGAIRGPALSRRVTTPRRRGKRAPRVF